MKTNGNWDDTYLTCQTTRRVPISTSPAALKNNCIHPMSPVSNCPGAILNARNGFGFSSWGLRSVDIHLFLDLCYCHLPQLTVTAQKLGTKELESSTALGDRNATQRGKKLSAFKATLQL